MSRRPSRNSPKLTRIFSIDYLKARNYYRQGQWENAKTLFERALRIFEEENATHHGVAATELKLACIALRQGRIDEAMYSRPLFPRHAILLTFSQIETSEGQVDC